MRITLKGFTVHKTQLDHPGTHDQGRSNARELETLLWPSLWMQNSHIIVPELSALLVSLIDFSMDTNCFKYPPLPWQPQTRSHGAYNSGWSVKRRSPHYPTSWGAWGWGPRSGSDHWQDGPEDTGILCRKLRAITRHIAGHKTCTGMVGSSSESHREFRMDKN